MKFSAVRSRRSWTFAAALTAGAVLVSGLQPGAAPTAAASSVLPPLPRARDVDARPLDPAKVQRAAAERAEAERQSASIPAPAWPAASEQVLSTTATAEHSTFGVGTPPSAKGRGAAAVPRAVRLRVFDHAKAEQAGIDGVLLTASRADSRLEKGTTQVQIDYSKFANAYGGDWRTRLKLVALPACALTTPQKAGCLTQTELGSTNDLRQQTLSAPVALDSNARLLAVTAASESTAGDYTATSLAAASSWAAGGSSGDFTWSYPLRVPPATGGPSPSLSFSYSAQSVDGRTVASNNQPSWVGEGFELSESYVERRYASCDDEGHAGKYDLCWKYDNATLVMNGKSNELVKSGSGWKLKDEDGSMVEKVVSPDNPDNNKEVWKVTTQDGTQYFFGQNIVPGVTTPTNSVFTVPVSGDTSGEECYNATFASSFCDQAWRWNLDYVVDPHGNAMTMWYAKETNYYAKNGSATANAAYTRGGYLTSIKYGQRSTALATTAPMQVVFGTQERCLSNCSSFTSTTKANWPDVPFDQICASGAACSKPAPTFFTRRRLETITTQVLKGTTYANVDRWQTAVDFPDPGDSFSGKALWLQSITHTGLAAAGETPAAPLKVTFGKSPLANRVDDNGDGSDGLPPMTKLRVGNIWTETGAQITVNYSGPECIQKTNMPASHDRNSLRCYPVKWTPPKETERDDWFHRYVVNQVRVNDLTGNADALVTNYTYSGGAAWHYQENAFIPKKKRDWAEWRGYKTVTVSQGDPAQPGPQSRQVTTYFRGMNGDKLAAGGTKSETVADTAGGTRADVPALAGQVRESITFQAAGSNTEVSGEITDYWVKPTATQQVEGAGTETTSDDLILTAGFVRPSATQSRTARDAGRPDLIRTVSTTYDDTTGLPVKSQDAGDSAKVDETCTLTSYASNAAKGLIAYPSRIVTSKGLCDAGSDTPGADRVLSDVRTMYDGGAFGAAPTLGEVSSTQRLSSYSSTGVAQYSPTMTTTYDDLGRPLSTTDALGRVTSTSYTPAGQGALTETAVQTPAISGTNTTRLKTTTSYLPEWGLPARVTDPNLKVTELGYDAMGRLTGVWLPNRSKSKPESPNTKYSYNLSATAPSSVRTDTLNITANGYNTSYALFDSLLRAKQTQMPAANGGRILSESKYNSRGQVVIENRDMWDDDSEPTGTFVSVDDASAPAETESTYDGVGRVTASTFAVYAQNKWTTRKVYGGDTVTTLPPAGAPATAEISDARGQIVERREYDSNVVTSGFIPTNYTYDLAGRLTKLVSGGSTWTYSYDLFGRKVGTTDPDAGASTYGYDEVDRMVSTTNAKQETLLTTYDNLDRKVTLHQGAKTDANLLASWLYDGSGNLGQVLGSIRYTAGKTGPQYKNLIVSRNLLYNPISTSVVIPATEGDELKGSYTTNTTYSPDDRTPSSYYLPGGGPIATETVKYTYTRLGQPSSLIGGYGTYAKNVKYTELGDPEAYDLGDDQDLVIQQPLEVGTRRLLQIWVAQGDTIHSQRRFSYDPAGNLLKDDNTVAPDVQCFDYDGHRRLTGAWTPASGNCDMSPTVSSLGGAAPYWQSWSYNTNGSRKTEVNHTSAGDTTATYTYAATQDHAVSKVATTGAAAQPEANYTYDNAGNTATRPGPDSQQHSLNWNSEGKLSKLSSQTGDTNYIYDAEGNLLLRKSPKETTLYVGSLEVTVDSSSSVKAVSAKRTYSIGGKDVAVRSNVDKIDWLATDYHNTSQLTLTNDTHTPTARYATPFGAARGPIPTAWPDTHNFLGKPEDKTTGLTHIGAREYDPTLGHFISVDPVLEPATPQSLVGYAYANNNPTSFSDATGLCALGEGETRCGSHPTPTPPADTSDDTPTPVSPSNTNQGDSGGSDHREHGFGGRDGHAFGVLKGFGKTALAQVKGIIPAARAEVGRDYNCVNGVLEECLNWVLSLNPAQAMADGLISAGQGVWRDASGGRPGEAVGTVGFYGAEILLARKVPLARKFCSFAGSTEVLMADGTRKPIKEVKPGDEVLAKDPETGRRGTKTVLRTWVHDDTVMDLVLDGGKLTTTEDHPFWSVTDGRFERADDLAPGELVLSVGNRPVRVLGLVPRTAHRAAAYNLSVADIHTYYVIAGKVPVLVHNDGGPGEGQIYLWRGVTDKELADISANRSWNSPSGVKYFSFTERGASEYARRAYAAFPGDSPYTMIRTTVKIADLPEKAYMPHTADVIDSGVALRNHELKILGRPSIMTKMSIGGVMCK
ncbi:polymorphic toxin-type HINT domain-containing protein [Kribbella sp. NPDC005582]|uniref:polymorphic toxin-type HINT domain-containing protein n=1 Tax=Kribbella sp. NPDC005582 TaxID=3156893 RepID=UPI0033BA80FC